MASASSRLLLIAVLAGAAAANASAPKKRTGGDSYIVLPTLTASVFSAGGGRGVLTLEVGLDVPDPALRKRTEDSLPRLRDAYTRVLGVYSPSLSPGRPPNVDAIADSLQKETDRVVGRGVKLLLGTVMVN